MSRPWKNSTYSRKEFIDLLKNKIEYCKKHSIVRAQLNIDHLRILLDALETHPWPAVHEFHKAMDLTINSKPTEAVGNDPLLRLNLIREEYWEWEDAFKNKDAKEMLDALVDLVYVIYGTAITYGIDINAAFQEIHRSNMTKFLPDGSVLRREDGKIIKPENYEPPKLVPEWYDWS